MPTLLAGCEEESGVNISKETVGQIGKEKTIKPELENDTESITSEHIIYYQNQPIKLLATYKVPKSRLKTWIFTSSAPIYLSLKTENIPSNVSLAINSVHSEVSLVSKLARLNGLKQDTIDKDYSFVNSYGFNIDDNNEFFLPFPVDTINANATSVAAINSNKETDTKSVVESDLTENVKNGALKTIWTIAIKDGDQVFERTVNDSIALKYNHTVKYTTDTDSNKKENPKDK